MKKTIFITLLFVVAMLGIYFLYVGDKTDLEQGMTPNIQNATYIIDGKKVTLKNGVSEIEISGSASKVITKYFGNELVKDLDGDGREDITFLLTQETGGSGTFFYVVTALNKEAEFMGSEALFLGDRIAPQTTESGPGKSIIVNYADRLRDEPMSARPSVGKSIRLILDPKTMQFGEVAPDFEGEADPKRMSLGMKTWIWQKTTQSDGKEILPKKLGVFTLTFQNNETFSATTDCNSMGGKYTFTKTTILFSDIVSTLMYCEGSQESDFVLTLQKAREYHFTSKGELIFDLESNGGAVLFR